MQEWNVDRKAQLQIPVLPSESSGCIPPRCYLVQSSTPFPPSHCKCKIGNMYLDNSAKGTYDSGSFLRQLLTLS